MEKNALAPLQLGQEHNSQFQTCLRCKIVTAMTMAMSMAMGIMSMAMSIAMGKMSMAMAMSRITYLGCNNLLKTHFYLNI